MYPEGSKSARNKNRWGNLNSRGRTSVRAESDEGDRTCGY